jgi:dimethylargininase
VRAVSRGFADAIVSSPSSSSSSSIDAALAAQQHARYTSLLSKACSSPLTVVELDAPDDLPDACFVEDTAVVVPRLWLPRSPTYGNTKGVAVIARPPAASRAEEPAAVARALREHAALQETVEVVGEITAPGALDGGDVLILPPTTTEGDGEGDPTAAPTTTTVLVGLSGRSNAEGAAQLRDLLAPRGVRVVPVPMAAALARVPGLHGSSSFHPLHLKSAVTALSADALLCADGPAGRAVAAAVHGALLRASPPPLAASPTASSTPQIPRLPTFAFLPEEDACAANVLLLGDAVIAQPSQEASRRVLEFLCERLGRRLVLLDPPLAEMKKADGALTCCSILF